MSLERFEHGVVCAQLHESVVDVARRMRDYRVGAVVVTRGATPIGIVTDRDVVLRVVAEGKSPAETKVADIVTYEPTTLPSAATIETAAKMMRERGVRRLPIVTDDGRITGMVTADDLFALLAREMADVSESVRPRAEEC